MTKTKHPGMDNVQAFNTVMLPVMRAAKKHTIKTQTIL